MQNSTSILGPKQSLIILLLSLITLFYWFGGNLIDIYQYAIVGAIFEILWLPMILLVLVLPALSLFFWIKGKWSLKSVYFYSFLIGVFTILLKFF